MNSTSPNPIDDEALSALLDGELGAQDTRTLRARLRAEPALAARLAALERVDAAVRKTLAPVDDDPVPQSVVDLLEAPAAAAAETTVVPLRARHGTRERAPTHVPWALAASIALGVGVALGVGFGRFEGSHEPNLVAVGPVAGGSALENVLQTVPSGATGTIAAGVAATPRLSFATADGDHCRQIDLTSSLGTTAAVACRRTTGWRLEVAAFEAADPAASNTYRPAAATPTAVDAAVDSLIGGDPLDAAAEAELIARGWPSRPH